MAAAVSLYSEFSFGEVMCSRRSRRQPTGRIWRDTADLPPCRIYLRTIPQTGRPQRATGGLVTTGRPWFSWRSTEAATRFRIRLSEARDFSVAHATIFPLPRKYGSSLRAEMHDRHDYIGTPAKAPMHPLLHALIKLAILYVAVYAICFAVEGAMRLKYGVGSVTAIEKRFSDHRQQSKALVERQKRIDAMNNDLAYDIYLVIVLFGTPIAMVIVIIHDIR